MPGNDSLVLLGHVLKQSKSWILTHGEYSLTPTENHTLQTDVERLLQGVPLPYILGEWEFYGHRFEVCPDVLIPRPETELLVEEALRSATDLDHPLIADVGCGSGIIAISLAAELPQSQVVALDLSRPALDVARRNATRHHAQIHFLQADLLQPVVGCFDLICANLPYIPSDILNQLDVARWEPQLALDGGVTGLAAIQRLLAQAKTRLAHHGTILLEIEASLGQNVLDDANKAFPNAEVELLKDLAGKDRLIKIQTR